MPSSYSKLTLEVNDTLDPVGFDNNLSRPLISAEGGISLEVDDIDSTVSTLGGDIISDVNANTDTKTTGTTTDVNTNTDTLKGTPVSLVGVIAGGSTLITLVDYTGSGMLKFSNLRGATSGGSLNGYKIKVTIDDEVVCDSLNNATGKVYLFLENGFESSYIYESRGRSTLAVVPVSANIPFKESLKVEMYAEGNARQYHILYETYV